MKTSKLFGLNSVLGCVVLLGASLVFCAVCRAEPPNEEADPADDAAITQEQPGGFEQVLNTGEDKRLTGTLAANVVSLTRGAGIFRVHDVKEAKDALAVAYEIMGS